MSHLEFSPFDRQLLKLAAKSAVAAAKGAKKAAAKALLTQAESEAHAMEGYADEANLFLDNPERIEDESGETVQLSFGHRTALRTGCLIRIAEIENMAEEQVEVFCDSDSVEGTRSRAGDFRRLESVLRTGESQGDLDLDKQPVGKGDAVVASAPEPEEEDLYEGPFDAPPVPARLALANPDAADIVDAEFEVLEDAEDHEAEVSVLSAGENDAADAEDLQDPPLTDGDDANDLTL